MISKQEKLMVDMAALYSNFKLSKSKLSGEFKASEQFVLRVDSDTEPDTWKAFNAPEGNFVKWQDIKGVSKTTISEFILTYKDLKAGQAEEKKEKLSKESADNLKAGGFEIPEEAPIVDQPKEEPNVTNNSAAQTGNPAAQTRTEKWSKPAPKKQPEQIPYDDGLEPALLPAITEIGIVRPAVTARQALAAWNEFQELKKYIIVSSDIQLINNKNHIKKSGWRKFATFYNLTDKIVEETRSEREDLGKGAFQWKIKVLCTAPNGRQVEGVAICTSVEKKFAHPEHDVYTTCHTRSKNRAISDMIAAGEVSAEEMEA